MGYQNEINSGQVTNITLDLPFLNIHNPFTNERISYTWTNIVACLLTQRITLLNKLATCLRAWLWKPQRYVIWIMLWLQTILRHGTESSLFCRPCCSPCTTSWQCTMWTAQHSPSPSDSTLVPLSVSTHREPCVHAILWVKSHQCAIDLWTAHPKWRLGGPALLGHLLYSLAIYAYTNRYHHHLVQ